MRPLPCNAQSGASKVDVVIKALEQPLKAASQAVRAIIADIIPWSLRGSNGMRPAGLTSHAHNAQHLRTDTCRQ